VTQAFLNLQHKVNLLNHRVQLLQCVLSFLVTAEYGRPETMAVDPKAGHDPIHPTATVCVQVISDEYSIASAGARYYSFQLPTQV
jgi:hypothetical protein